MKSKNAYILDFRDIDKSMLPLVGGKGANLGELSRIDGIRVPDGFCISTEAFKRIIEETPRINELLERLSHLQVKDRGKIIALTSEIRMAIEGINIPQDIIDEIDRVLARLGENNAFAVRSSATAEDLPTSSFAGQQDTYLNIIGKKSILHHISKCWASLFTERAVTYRIQNDFDHRKVQLSVVVQKMVFPQAAGIMFTADPVSSNRKVLSIDASFGLGEALVAGLVNADNYKVSNGSIINKKISAKKLSILAQENGGTIAHAIEPALQNIQALTDEQVLELARSGRMIEAHFDSPQDIEWCLVDDIFYFVQSRPITTLYPIPETNDSENHVYISVGHQQMMTDAMKPLGLAFWLFITPPSMRTAGSRLFMDVAPMLATAAGRDSLINALGKFDPLIKNAMTTIVERGDFIRSVPDDKKEPGPNTPAPLPDYRALNDYDPSIPAAIIKKSQAAIEELKQTIKTKSGPELFDFIREDIPQSKKFTSDPQSFGVIMTGMNAAMWINENMKEWLGEKNIADTLALSAPNNVTAEMGLELLDVADAIRPYPEIIQYLQQTKDDNFLNGLDQFEGGRVVKDAIDEFLRKYGMRCSGEIDITKTRWSEKPATLFPTILSHIKNFEPGEGKRKFEQGRQEALQKEQQLISRLKELPDGEQKAKETKRMIDLMRNLAGYREYPKYAIITRYFIYKQAVMKEAEQLVQANVLHAKEDAYYLSFDEFQETVRSGKVDYALISKRKADFKTHEKLIPPRVMTSDGEIINGTYNLDNIPDGAIAGLAVSSGVIEGRARVIVNMEDANLEEGDILVTAFTDPSWTPLFVSIKGLVTEVGGLMTHGAVIAREYGLPAVVGVDNATRLIKDKQQIRVHGTEGYIEIL